MRRARCILSTTIAALLLGSGTLQAAGSGDVQLIEDLRQLAQQARQRNAADRWLQRSLDDLVARYDRPWQRTLLLEDFGDGDFTRNPSWQVLSGQFQVVRGQGLTASVGGYPAAGYNSSYPATLPGSFSGNTQQTPEGALSSLIVGALLGNGSGNTPAGGAAVTPPGFAGGNTPNRIQLQANVTNAFALTATVRAAGAQDTRFELALLQSQQAQYGYRLRVDTGARGFIELERIRGGRGAIVESQPLQVALNDGRFHDIGWQQTPDGTVTVNVDDKPVFQVRDRAFRDPYPWLVLDHQNGDLTLRSIRIDGV